MRKLICFLFLSFFFASISHGQNPFRVERKGTGAPILFLPGFGSSGDVWDQVIAEFPEHESITLTYAMMPVEFGSWFTFCFLKNMAAFIIRKRPYSLK